MIKLTNRLQTIADLVKKEDKVLDIGCDHGLLDIYLNENNIKVIASDINANALEQMKKNLIKYHIQNKMDIRLGSGLKTIENGEVDTIIMAGMGTETILSILQEDKEKLKRIKTIITQSNKDQEALRRGICRYGYYIKQEQVILDKNHYYTIILFQKGFRLYSKKDLYLGPQLIKNSTPIYQKMLEYWYHTNEKIITLTTNKKDRKTLQKRQQWIQNTIKKDI